MADRNREDDAIRAVVDLLSDAYRATHHPAEVEEAVAKAYASFAGRPVRDFIPVLVERKARAILDESSG